MGRGVLIAVGIHLFLAGLVCLILYIMGIQSLKQLLEKGGAIASSGPAPQIVVELKLEEVKPPPTDHIEWEKQILKPKPIVIVKPPPKPKPVVKPIVKVIPRFTAPKATGSGTSNAVSAFKAGTSGLPHPSYPYAELQAGHGGTVMMHVTFDGGGNIANADIVGSSGYTSIDSYTRLFIYEHWKNTGLNGQSFNVPIVYDPGRGSVGVK